VGGESLDIVLQLVLNGLAVGCIYGLVALGFVLIYKATELVNFAQGDLMMLGAFTCYMLVVWYGIGYWVAFAGAVAVVGLFGAVLDAGILRRVLGQPQFAVVMLTIGLAAVFRSFASIVWGTEIYTLPTPFSAHTTRIAGVSVSHEYVSIIVGTVILCAVLYAFFTYTKVGVAMQAVSQNQLAAYYMGIPVKLMCSLIWAISAGVAAIAGVLLAPSHCARRAAAGHLRRGGTEEGLSARHPCAFSSRPPTRRTSRSSRMASSATGTSRSSWPWLSSPGSCPRISSTSASC